MGAGEVDGTEIQRIAGPKTALFRRFEQIVLGYLYAGNPAGASPERLQSVVIINGAWQEAGLRGGLGLVG